MSARDTAPAHRDPAWLAAPVPPVDTGARTRAAAHQRALTKPPGSLGRLEELAVDLAGWQGSDRPVVERCRIRVFAADHGIVAEGVSAFPQTVTGEMIRNFARGGAAISVLAREMDADFGVVSLGTAQALPVEVRNHPLVTPAPVAPGSGNICNAAAMTQAQLAAALEAGATAAGTEPVHLFVGGEMGIGNTAVTAALTAALLDLSAEATVGPGTGIDAAALGRKRAAVARALALHRDHCTGPLETLRRLGGLEIAALTGAYVAAAQRGIPSLVDGYISSAAALLACRLNPAVRGWLAFAHCSAEPGHRHLLAALDARPLLDLGMRLGEGSGAGAALPLLRMACRLHNGMATFDEAGVSAG